MLRTALAVVCLVGCHRAPATPMSNTVPPTPPDAAPAPEPSECERYATLKSKADACSALSEEARQNLEQWDIDMLAAVSESGMDDSTPVDEERLCEEAADHIIVVATTPCAW